MDFCIVVAELRPNIGCCQFFIKMNQRTNVSKVLTDSNKIFIKGRDNIDIAAINIGNITIACDSLSGLLVSDYSVQFRVRIEPKKIYGSFKSEMLFKEQNTIFDAHSDYYRPDIKANEEVTIFCRLCTTAINEKPCKFKRVLPLPTSFDTSDFFCHNNPFSNDIEPKPEDCLFGLYFVQINLHQLVADFRNTVVICFHCKAWLGVREKNSIMFWNSSVKFKDSSQDKTNSGLCDFISLIKYVIKNDIAASKVILYTRLTDDENHYLLIWILEKNLSLLINKNTNGAEVLLKKQKVVKVLYLHETEESNRLKKWENDINTSRLQISKQMMTEGLAHLKGMSQNIPEDYREANQMLVSYIMA